MTGKCGLFKNMVRLSSLRGGRVLAICASFYEKHFLFSTVSLMSLLLIYKHSLYVREVDFCHRCVNYFLLKLYFFAIENDYILHIAGYYKLSRYLLVPYCCGNNCHKLSD